LSFPKNGTQLRINTSFLLKTSKKNIVETDSIEVLLDGIKFHNLKSITDSVQIPKTKIGYRTLSFKPWKNNTLLASKDLQVLILSDQREKKYTYEIVETTGHNVDDYTQGLEINDGFLYEGTGLYGKSKLKKSPFHNDGSSAGVDLDEKYFGEGVTVLNDKVFQLTWQERKVFVYEKQSLQKITEFDYPINMEGWGLANDGEKLFASTGSNEIYIINPSNFQIENTLHILNYDGVKLKNLNELEYVDGYILDWEELLEISLLPDIFDILIIGDEKAENLHKYDSDKEMIESCDFTIELVDSSYFLVNSRNTRFLEVLKAEFGGISCQWE